jgi:hypothetical protein
VSVAGRWANVATQANMMQTPVARKRRIEASA